MKLGRVAMLSLAVLVLACHAGVAQENGNGRHARLFAVPTPGPVVIDGQLTDWDRSGELESYVMAATRAMQYGKMAVMYDGDALYLGGVIRKPIPINNRHSPEANGDRAWDADAIQFRLTVDPTLGYPVNETTASPDSSDQIIHLLLWYYADRQEPCLQAHSSMRYRFLPGAEKFGVLPKTLYQAAYRFTADRHECTFEYRIPWKTLGAKRPLQGGDVVAATYQFNFGRRDGLKTAGYSGWAYDLKVAPGFSYQNAGCWGKLVFAKTGNLPKALVQEGEPPARPLPCTFTCDVLEDGEVSVVLYNDKHEAVRVLMASTPRQAGRLVEKWDGLDELDTPLPAGTYTWKGLYHQPITTRYLLSVHNSGQPAYKNDENTGGWGGDHGVPSAICTAGDDLLLAWNYNEAGWGLIRTDMDGKKRWGIINSQGFLASDGQRVFASTHEFGAGLRCFDVKDGRPLPWGNGTSVLALPPGVQAAEISGMAYGAGKLYASFAQHNLVAVYDATRGDLQTTWRVPAPGALAARPDGTLAAISNARLVQLREGEITPLADHHLDHPAGIAVGADGKIYVANQGRTQNIAIFTPAGTFVKSLGKAGGRPWIGRFDPKGMLEPAGIALDAKGRLWVAESIDYPKRVSVWDPKSGKLVKEFFGGAHYASFIWMDPERPDEVYCDGVIWKVDWKKLTAAPYSTCWRSREPEVPGAGGFSTHTGGFRPFTAQNGRQYGFDIRFGIFYQRDGDIFKPIIAGTPKGLWVDRNHDQRMQPEEINGTVKAGFAFVDPALNLWGRGIVYRPLRVEKSGRPVYDFSKPEPTANFQPVGIDPADASLYAYDNGYDWSGSLKGFDYGRFGADGTVYWGYRGRVSWPRAINHPPQRLAKIWGITQLLGTAGDFTGFATYYGCHHLYTRRDGIPVAMLFRDPRIALGELGADVIACENYNGQLVKPKGMNRYFALGGDQDGRISEVFGLETVKYLAGGTYTHTEADVKATTDALTQYQAALARTMRLVIVRGAKALPTAPVVERVLTNDQSFKARMAYDAQNLYVHYDVVSAAELNNAMTDPQTIFKGGNLLDIQLAADTSADPKRQTPVPGDLRLLVTRQNGKPYAVIFRPKVKGFTGVPTVLTSPTGKESFDAIEVTQAVQLAYRKQDGAFSATLTIPLATLGWTPQPGAKVRLDLGYIFGNTTGTKAMGRLYWTNTGFAAGVLNDIPTESRLVPGEWGEAEVE
jgi:DNA-binding beta-propeller fold protein YncE